MTVRVRIAPSPTGNLHVGTARAALFNWLFARQHEGGRFILRVEDTDRERSLPKFEQNIYDGLHALGLQWDEGPDVGGDYGPYRQSERSHLYTQWAEALLASGKAYYSYETDEELEAMREKAKLAGQPFAYRKPSKEILAAHAAESNRPKSLRFEIPQPYGPVVVEDAVRGSISFDSALLGDFVILKSDGGPTYNFANVVDDSLMAITHVIRGEDHVSNTPRQILLYQAFAELGSVNGTPCLAKPPVFAHASMILAPDRTKLSKRFGATAVADYIAMGYLPEAFCNFLSLLGWSPPEGQEIGTLNEYAKLFSFDRMAQSPAIFETDKLNFLNKHYLKQLSPEGFAAVAEPFIKELPWSEYSADDKMALLERVREPITLLRELPDALSYFFGPTVAIPQDILDTVVNTADGKAVLMAFKVALKANAFDISSLEAAAASIKGFIPQLAPLKAKAIMWPIRAAVSGRTHGADLNAILYYLGHQRVLARVEAALALKLTPSPVA